MFIEVFPQISIVAFLAMQKSLMSRSRRRIIDQIIAVVLLVVVEGEADTTLQKVGQIALSTGRPIPPFTEQILGNGHTSELGIQIIPFQTLTTFITFGISVASGNGIGKDAVILMLE